MLLLTLTVSPSPILPVRDMGFSECSCGLRFANIIDLQFHAMDCRQQQSEEQKCRRRSSRNKKKTPKGEAYSQMLLSESQSKEEEIDKSESEAEEIAEGKMKDLEESIDRLSLDEVVVALEDTAENVTINIEEVIEVAEDVQGLLDDLDALLEEGSDDLHEFSVLISNEAIQENQEEGDQDSEERKERIKEHGHLNLSKEEITKFSSR